MNDNEILDEQSLELLRDCMGVLRSNAKELVLMYQTAKQDWNSVSRKEIAKDLADIVPTLMHLEYYFAEEEE
tara:strand:+ start:556 stop:771 length:216 start_codon:yes stop_codon:yes gene_type:complete